ncbi:hypothetical protein BDV32DRAFT_123362 [Aspergillus pseudonomiae]|uniref:Uncharacterized protein n=1 Tax=Aspergillus pseudonomiae TaxID=1506151 RepID=A0A5N6I2E8_9EURO|nr:uncharacterized protein BDV37DRAFT_280138 [Aspergillus pseudonomiae]KAB8260227.1 hypothetical protein BDV32DRAFT_123362 [Aspergillus pseudonomiae]KAE8407228.1 hypothetical protein BDV37DRAFT_280138 [Aspergillus pseudonomiae]
MRFSVLTALALVGAALATPQAAKIPSGQPCKQDGSMGVCDSGLCVQTPSQAQGVCK